MTGYADAAAEYLARGWQPLPVFGPGKGVTPKGYTGYHGQQVTAEDVAEWSAKHPAAGLCLRLVGVVGLDLDAYADKGAGEAWGALCARLGPLEPTWLSSSRLGEDWDGLSGIRLFALPSSLQAQQQDAVWKGNLGPGIDVIRFAHRQVNAYPKLHPTRDTVYCWLSEGTGEVVEGVIPVRPEELPVLPPAWAEELLKPEAEQAKHQQKPAAGKSAGGNPAQWWTPGEPCKAVQTALGEVLAEFLGSPHDTTVQGMLRLTRLGEQGHRGVAAAVDELHTEFINQREAKAFQPEPAEQEWQRAVDGIWPEIMRQGLTPPDRVRCCGQADEDAGQPGADSRKGRRRLVVTRASDIKLRRVEWAWRTDSGGRMPVGELAIVAGQPGRGKSTKVNQLAALVTRGTLPGKFFGAPKSVIVSATEESWETTIAPKLAAVGADMNRVLRVEAMTYVAEAEREVTVGLNLSTDVGALEDLMKAEDVGMLVLDPIISRLGKLDTYKDAEVRVALDPLVEVLHRTGAVAVGIMHFNKGEGDALKLLMGSTAFGAVARSVHVVEKDPDNPGERLFATVKANMGRDDLPMLRFRMQEVAVQTADGPATVPVAVDAGEDGTGRSFTEVQRQIRRESLYAERVASGVRTQMDEAAEFLAEWMRTHNFEGKSSDIKAAAKGHEIPEATLKRARARMGITVSPRAGFGGETWWTWPQGFADAVGSQSAQPPGGP